MCLFDFRFSYGYQQDYGMGPGPRPGMLSYEDGVSTDWTHIITYNIKYGGTQCKKTFSVIDLFPTNMMQYKRH